MTTKTTTATTVAKPTTSYATSYATLAGIAERLKGAGTAAGIDTLAEDVRAARLAYAACRGRLDAIRTEIDAELAAGADGAPG